MPKSPWDKSQGLFLQYLVPLVKLRERHQFDYIDPPLPRFALRGKALWPAELRRHLHLGESRRLPRLAEPLEEHPIRH